MSTFLQITIARLAQLKKLKDWYSRSLKHMRDVMKRKITFWGILK